MFFPYLMSKWIYIKYFEIFTMAAICGFGRVFELSWVQRQDRPGYSLHVELLFDVLAQILRELWLFQRWPTFWPRDLVIWPLTHKNYRVLCCGRLQMWTKFSDDWSKTATFIAENVIILFKHEYRRPTLTSQRDVISDVINIKSTFFGSIFDGLSISNVEMNLSKIFRNFQNSRHFEVRWTFKPEVVPEVDDAIKIGLHEYYVVVL